MRIVFGKTRSRHKVIFEQNSNDCHFVHVTFCEYPKDSSGSIRTKYSYWIIDDQLDAFKAMMAKNGMKLETED